MSVYKRGKGTHWHYYFRVRGVRYRGSIPEARTKQKAEQAESKIKQEIFEKRFEVEQKGIDLLSDFLDGPDVKSAFRGKSVARYFSSVSREVQN